MTDSPYSAAELVESKQQTRPAERTFVFSWWALGMAAFFALLFSTSVVIAEGYFNWWPYTSRVELVRSLSGVPPPSGSVLNRGDILAWAIASAICIHLPRFLLTLLVFVPLFLRLCQAKPGRSERRSADDETT